MIFVEDLKNPEGPVLLPDGSWLIVEMAPERGWVLWISPDGKKRKVLAKTGRPNGLALGKDGTVWVAESRQPSLLKMAMDGSYEVFLTACNGEPFLFPNDLAFGPDGAMYMTDSGVLHSVWRGAQERAKGGMPQGETDGRVYRIDRETKEVVKLDSGLKFTNGIAFGPDGCLYANETLTGNIVRYRNPERSTAEREVFANVLCEEWDDRFRGTDGMAFGQDGRLYVTVLGEGCVAVVDPDGTVCERLPLDGKMPTNVAFGRPGEKRIYVTEQGTGQMERLDVETEGMALYG